MRLTAGSTHHLRLIVKQTPHDDAHSYVHCCWDTCENSMSAKSWTWGLVFGYSCFCILLEECRELAEWLRFEVNTPGYEVLSLDRFLCCEENYCSTKCSGYSKTHIQCYQLLLPYCCAVLQALRTAKVMYRLLSDLSTPNSLGTVEALRICVYNVYRNYQGLARDGLICWCDVAGPTGSYPEENRLGGTEGRFPPENDMPRSHKLP